jgi:hypothetical protein
LCKWTVASSLAAGAREPIKTSLLTTHFRHRSGKVPDSVLDAIKLGIWDYEPNEMEQERYDPTEALPGTDEKLAILADRVRQGLPLWHPEDRRSYDDTEVVE